MRTNRPLNRSHRYLELSTAVIYTANREKGEIPPYTEFIWGRIGVCLAAVERDSRDAPYLPEAILHI